MDAKTGFHFLPLPNDLPTFIMTSSEPHRTSYCYCDFVSWLRVPRITFTTGAVASTCFSGGSTERNAGDASTDHAGCTLAGPAACWFCADGMDTGRSVKGKLTEFRRDVDLLRLLGQDFQCHGTI